MRPKKTQTNKKTRDAQKKKQQKKRGFTKKNAGWPFGAPQVPQVRQKTKQTKNRLCAKKKQINAGAPLAAPHAPLARHVAKPRKPGSSKISDVTFVKIEVLPISKGLFRYFDKESRKTCLK